MIIPDINLLVYAYNSASPAHLQARDWWEASLRAGELIGLAPVAALGFVRLLSNPRVVLRPVPPPVLLDTVQAWLATGRVRLLAPGARHFQIMQELFAQSMAGSNLTTDIHLAALAVEHQGTLCSNDTDFLRFKHPDLVLVNPLA